MRVIGNGGDVIHALILTLEDVLHRRFGPIEIGVDDHAVARARHYLTVAGTGQIFRTEDVRLMTSAYACSHLASESIRNT